MVMISVGWLGSLAFAVCTAPQALLCYQQGHARGISMGYLLLWFLGEVLSIVYVLGTLGWNLPLLANYVSNLFFLGVIFYYKVRPRPLDY